MSPEDALIPLGFTETEALAYCELLRAGPSTGYRIAQGIGKAQANTYKTLSTLAQKGAVIDDGGEPRAFRAVAPDQLVHALSARFAEQAQAAAKALAKVKSTISPEDRLYQLRAPDRVWAQAEAMIDAAVETVLFDCSPPVEARLNTALARAAARGVAVLGVAYDDAHARPGGYLIIHSRMADDVAERWPGAILRLVTDASQYLLCLLSDDLSEVRHGLWSDSAYLAVHEHYSLMAEMRLQTTGDLESPFAKTLADAALHKPGLRRLLASPSSTTP